MKRFFLIILTIIMSFVVFEFFLRFSPFGRGISPVVYDEKLGMWHKKNFSSFVTRKCYKNQYFFDNKGRVKNNYLYDNNKTDIVILGDSFIDALMIKNKSILHNALFDELEGKFNVLNYGLTGSGPMQQWGILKYKVLLDNVEKIIQVITLEGDLADCDPSSFNGSNRPKLFFIFSNLENYITLPLVRYGIKEKIRDFFGKFELYAYLNHCYVYYKSLFGNTSNKGSDNKPFFMPHEEYRWKQLKGTIYQINKMASKYKFTYHVLIYSSDEFYFNNKTRSKRFESFLNQKGIPYLNIVPYLKIIKQRHELSFKCDEHWNGETHKDLAKYIKQELFR